MAQLFTARDIMTDVSTKDTSIEIEEASVCDPLYSENDTEEEKQQKPAACVAFSKNFHLPTGQRIVVVDGEDKILDDKNDKIKYCVLGSRDHVAALKAKVTELANKVKEAEAQREAAQKRCENVGEQLDTLVTDEEEQECDKIFRRPRIRQYFKGDTLYREREERKTSDTELFWDLIFVGSVSLLGHDLAASPDIYHLEVFALTFIPLWKIWTDIHNFLNMWGSEDLVQKMFLLWVNVIGYVNDQRVSGATLNQFVDHVWFNFYPIFMKYWGHDTILCIRKPLYRPAINIEHMADRLGSFVIITLGECVISTLYISWSPSLNQQAGKAVLGLLLAYSLHWLYFDVEASRQYKHALRRHILTGLLFSFLHLPLCASINIVGDTMNVLVQTMDFPGSEYIERDPGAPSPPTEIPNGIDWMFCGSLAVAIFCLATIGLSHQSMDKVDLMKIHKRWRISLRYLMAAIIAILPLAKLNSLYLLTMVCSLTIFLVIIETYGRLRGSKNVPKSKDNEKEGEKEGDELDPDSNRGIWVRWASVFNRDRTSSTLSWTDTFTSSRTLSTDVLTKDGGKRRWFTRDSSRSSLDEKRHGTNGHQIEMCI
ncbi:hypothetical protein BC937DRAFT_89933 [Endogone sp. FLAS-F59071]|nr:hypothetical protein BC937DRAFT_89933 [Endogone sp. FLAS-F59071]|eukprot:RUS17475.1 hypothetical protein BC937DRAFT_89933 [Endogone sp. FLAS-F59071]